MDERARDDVEADADWRVEAVWEEDEDEETEFAGGGDRRLCEGAGDGDESREKAVILFNV